MSRPRAGNIARNSAIALISLFVLLAVSADCLASDRPIASSVGGDRSFFPNMRDRGPRGESLSKTLGDNDWALWPPLRFGPLTVRTGERIAVLEAPSVEHWLGTDDRGRDVLARLIHGARSTLILAFGTVIASLALGVCFALLACVGPPSVRRLVGAAADLGSGIPVILLVVAVAGLWGRSGLLLAVAVLAVPRTADVTRIAVASMSRALAQPFADAARASGVGRARLLIRHALPAALPQLWVAAAVTATMVVLAEAALSFLGFGTPPPQASWGELFAQAHNNGLRWWLVLPPGLCAASLAAAFGSLARGVHRLT